MLPHKLIAVVVLYHPAKVDLLPNLHTLEAAVDSLLLVDNTEGGSLWFSEWCDDISAVDGLISKAQLEKNNKFVFFRPKENVGISAAQNLALKYAIRNYDDKDCVIFLDQDSDVSADLPELLAERFVMLNQRESVAAVGPLCIDREKGFFYWPVVKDEKGVFQRLSMTPQEQEQPVGALISSGMLTSVEMIRSVGFYDEDLFIDYVDTDWCMKAQSNGYLLYVIPSVQMTHSIGEESVKVLGRNFSVHSSVRRYYMIRNSFFMAKKAYVSPRQSMVFVYREIIKHIILMMLGKGKKNYFRALWRGVWDGILGRVRCHKVIVKTLL